MSGPRRPPASGVPGRARQTDPDAPPTASGTPTAATRRPAERYGATMRLRDGSRANFTRPALAPALLAAAALSFCVGFTEDTPFYYLRLGVTVLALITLVFAWNARNRIAMAGLVVIVILWNPILTVPIPAPIWVVMQLAGAAAFVALGILIRVPEKDH